MVSSGPTTTSVLRSWRKKDASEKQSSNTSSTEPSSGTVSENQGPVARVAPHNHYPKPPPADTYRYPQQYGDYGVQNVPQLPAPVKYSEIIEPMQSIEPLTPILQKPKEKPYLDMCNVQQNHMKPYQDYPNYKQHYDGLKNYNHVPTYKQQYHPYLKESQMPSYAQKETNIPPQYLHNYKMSPPNYPRNYPRESNEFLTNLNKIAPDMAQDIINDPHLRDPHLREPQFPMYPPAIDQSRLYQQQQHQRMYQRTSPIQHGVQNYGQRPMPQNFNQYQMNQQRMPPSDPYRMYPHQRYGQVEQIPTNMSPRQYHENVMGFPSRISPNYPPCGQLEYSQHYQHRQVPMRQEFLPIPNKPYIEAHPEIPEIVPDESIHQPKKTLKAFLENWREEFTEEVESAETIATDKIQLVKSTVPNRENTLYVLDAMEIPSENIPQYLHLQSIDKLPPNIRAFTYNTEENVRQNAIVISANMKGEEAAKNDEPKDNSNTYQLFQNKDNKNGENIVYQPNISVNSYKSEEILSHEDRPACKLLQSMAKARNANANDRPVERHDSNVTDRDKILRNCFQEPQKEIYRSLPQLISEETTEISKNEEHLENEYSKIVDSLLEENTRHVDSTPTPTNAGGGTVTEKVDEKQEGTEQESHVIETNNNVSSRINFAENDLMKSLEVVERKSVIAENTLPHHISDNFKHTEQQNSCGYSPDILEHKQENSIVTHNENIPEFYDEERTITKITNERLEIEEQYDSSSSQDKGPSDFNGLSVLEDPIDLSHHFEDINLSKKDKIEASAEDALKREDPQSFTDTEEKNHIHTDTLLLKNVVNLTKQSSSEITEEIKEDKVFEEHDNVRSEDDNDNDSEEGSIEEREIEIYHEDTKRLENYVPVLENLENQTHEDTEDDFANETSEREDFHNHNFEEQNDKKIDEDIENAQIVATEIANELESKDDSNVKNTETKLDTRAIPKDTNEDVEDKIENQKTKEEVSILEPLGETTLEEENQNVECVSKVDTIHENIIKENVNCKSNKDDYFKNIVYDEETENNRHEEEPSNNTKEVLQKQIKVEYDSDESAYDEIQDDVCIKNKGNIVELSIGDIKEEDSKGSSCIDSTTTCTNEYMQDINENDEDEYMNEESVNTLSEESNFSDEDTPIDKRAEVELDDNAETSFEETKSPLEITSEPSDINENTALDEVTKSEKDLPNTGSNETALLEDTQFEEDISENCENQWFEKGIATVHHDEEIGSNVCIHSEEITSCTIVTNVLNDEEILEDGEEMTTSNSSVDVEKKEENNNEVFKPSVNLLKSNVQIDDDKNIERYSEELLCNHETNLEYTAMTKSDASNLKQSPVTQHNEMNENCNEGNLKDEVGSSFVLEIAKELLQISVMEDDNGEKVITVTPLTKVKVITSTEIIEDGDKRFEKLDEEISSEIVSDDNPSNIEKDNAEEENHITSTVEEQDENQDIIFDENHEYVEETVVVTDHLTDEGHLPEGGEIIDETEILVETCNEMEAIGLIDSLQDENVEEVANDNLIEETELSLQSEVIIENKDETSDGIPLDNAPNEVVIGQEEEIVENVDEGEKFMQEERTINNNYIEKLPHEKHEKNEHDEDGKIEDIIKRSSVQHRNKKSFRSKKFIEKKIADTRKSQLNALRSFRKIKARNQTNFEFNQQKKVNTQSSKRRKRIKFDLLNIEDIKPLDSSEKAKIFSSVVVIDKIPIDTIKKVTAERKVEKKLNSENRKSLKKSTKFKVNEKKFHKEYSKIKRKFKRHREVARDIKRFMRLGKKKPADRKKFKTSLHNKDDAVKVDDENVKKEISVLQNQENKQDTIEPANSDKNDVSSEVVQQDKSDMLQNNEDVTHISDTNVEHMDSSFKDKKDNALNETPTSDKLSTKTENVLEKTQFFKPPEKRSKDLTILSNTTCATLEANNILSNDDHTKPMENTETVIERCKSTKNFPASKQTEYSRGHFQTPAITLKSSIQNVRCPKELRRTKSDNHFNSDFLYNFKKRRLSLEEYNNRKRNLQKLADMKMAKVKKDCNLQLADTNKEKQMVEEVLKSLKCELHNDIQLTLSDNIECQIDSCERRHENLKDENLALTSSTDTNMKLKEATSESISKEVKGLNASENDLQIENNSVEVQRDKTKATTIQKNITDTQNSVSPVKNEISKVNSLKKLVADFVKVNSLKINKVEIPNEEKLGVNLKEKSLGNATTVQPEQSTNSTFAIHKTKKETKESPLVETERPKEQIDKSAIEEKLNSLEEFLPKIAPKDLAQVEISRKLEDLLAENPITYDQKHSEMLLIKRFLNHEDLTPEELKRVRQIVHYKRAFQSIKKSTSDAPKRRYSSDLSKSIKIDFNDFDLTKLEQPSPPPKKEERNRERICYNRSISAFVEAESKKNASGETRNRRNSEKFESENRISWINKDKRDRIVNKEVEHLQQTLENNNERASSIISSVIVENISKNKSICELNHHKENSVFDRPQDSSNIVVFTSPGGKPTNNSRGLQAYKDEEQTFRNTHQIKSLEVDIDNTSVTKFSNTFEGAIERKSLEKCVTEKPKETYIQSFKMEFFKNKSPVISQDKSKIDVKITNIDKIENLTPKESVIVDKNVENISKIVGETTTNNESVTKDLKTEVSPVEPFARKEKIETQSIVHSTIDLSTNVFSTANIKHTIQSMISKKDDQKPTSSLGYFSSTQCVSNIKKEMCKISSPTKPLKHAIENIIKDENSGLGKITNVKHIELNFEKMSKNISSNLENVKCANQSIIPEKNIGRASPNTSEDKYKKVFNIESSPNVCVAAKSKDMKYISPSRISTSSQYLDDKITNPPVSKISKQNENIMLDQKKRRDSSMDKDIDRTGSCLASPSKSVKQINQNLAYDVRQKRISKPSDPLVTEDPSSRYPAKDTGKIMVAEENRKRNFEKSPVRKNLEVEKSSKVNKTEKTHYDIEKETRSFRVNTDNSCEKSPLPTKKENEKISENLSTNKTKYVMENKKSNKTDDEMCFEKSSLEKHQSAKKVHSEKAIKNSEVTLSSSINREKAKTKANPLKLQQSVSSKELPQSSSIQYSNSNIKFNQKESFHETVQVKPPSKTKAQLKSFQDSMVTKSENKDVNPNISPVISNITKLTALLTYYKKGLESGADTANLKTIEEIINKLSPNLKNLPDVNMPNEYEVSKPEMQDRKLKLHLKKVEGRKKKKRFRNLYTENDSEEDGGAEPKVKEAKMDDENSTDYSVYQRKSPAGVPKLVIKRRKSDFKSNLQPYVRITRISSIETMVKKRKRSMLVNQVFVDN